MNLYKYRHTLVLFICVAFFNTKVSANPYWDVENVPKDRVKTQKLYAKKNHTHLKNTKATQGIPVLRIQIDWSSELDTYSLGSVVLENSGTPALIARSVHKPKWGSYLGVLKDKSTGQIVYYDSIGTGKEYRKLARAISLRFPKPDTDMDFELFAENPQSGIMESVLQQRIHREEISNSIEFSGHLEIKELALASKSPSLRVNIYAEGYKEHEIKSFWKQAVKTVEALKIARFPGVESMDFYAVFSPSNQGLGKAEDLGFPVPEFDSFLGLYYPYWDNFGRWYHVVYPTREAKFRNALAVAPYDYPIVLVNSSFYWGVGNYKSHTAIPANNTSYFTYLLLHEIGHFFGLNEEYEGGGRTELEFALDKDEPWSPNITFLSNPGYDGLKWNQWVNQQTTIPTPFEDWHPNPPVYGAYHGGYADSPVSKGQSYKPGLNCIMKSSATFCDICTQGILEVIHHDLGLGIKEKNDD